MTGTAWILAEFALYNLGAWLLTYLIHSTVILGLAWALVKTLRPAPAWEAAVWRSALLGGVATASVRLAAGEVPGEAWLVGGVAEMSGTVGVIGAVAAATWIVVASIRLEGWRRARRRILDSIGARRPVDDEELRGMTEELARALGLSGALRITRAPGIASPVAVGRDEVCLPERGFEELDVPQQRSVLAHEIGHLAVGDPRWRLVGQLVRAALFVQPLNRAAVRRLREVAEYRADDVAVGCVGAPVPLVEALHAFASAGRPAPDPGGSGFASLFARRAERLLGERAPGAGVAGSVRAAVALPLLLLALGLGVPGVDPPCDCRLRAAWSNLTSARTEAPREGRDGIAAEARPAGARLAAEDPPARAIPTRGPR